MELDLYPLLRQYAVKNATWEVPFTPFLETVQRSAKVYAAKSADLAGYAENAAAKVTAGLYKLAASKQIAFISAGTGIHSILLPERFIEPLMAEYKRMADSPDVPFPEEGFHGTPIPTDWVLPVSLETDLPALLAREELPEAPIVKISFVAALKSILVPTELVREDLLELSVFKIQHYLRKGSNMEFVRRKLCAAFVNKDGMVRDGLHLVMTRPLDAITQLQSSGQDMVFSFWAYLISHVRQDINKRGQRGPEDLAILQASSIVEFFNNHYKGIQQRNLEVETALRLFDQAIRKPPYSFRQDELYGFSDPSGRPLMGRYTRDQIDAYLRSRTQSEDVSRLPEILTFVVNDDRRWYLAKDRVLILAVKLIADARAALRARYIEEWFKVLGDFRRVPAMDSDDAYRKELGARLAEASPLLWTLMENKYILLAYVELKGTKDSLPELERLFAKGDLVPVDELLSLSRKGLLADVRILLPFWYSLGPLVALARLLRSMGLGKRKRRAEEKAQAAKMAEEARRSAAPPDRQRELRDAALRAEARLVPEGMDLDAYLVEMESKWNSMISPEAKRDLTEDVNSLIRDYLRGILRSMKGSSFTAERVLSLADTLAGTPALIKIRNSQALKAYIAAYMVRLVKKASA